MRHTPRPISEELRADEIESGNDVLYEWLVGAITYKTREDLKNLGNEYMRTELKVVVEQSRQAEKIILDKFAILLPRLTPENRGIAIPITLDMKEKMREVLPAIQYLYNNRYGDLAGTKLNALFNTDKDEPFVLIFVIGRTSSGRYFLEKLILEKTNEKENYVEKKE